MTNRARFLHRRDDRDVAEMAERAGQCLDAFGMHAIVIGNQDLTHGNL